MQLQSHPMSSLETNSLQKYVFSIVTVRMQFFPKIPENVPVKGPLSFILLSEFWWFSFIIVQHFEIFKLLGLEACIILSIWLPIIVVCLIAVLTLNQYMWNIYVVLYWVRTGSLLLLFLHFVWGSNDRLSKICLSPIYITHYLYILSKYIFSQLKSAGKKEEQKSETGKSPVVRVITTHVQIKSYPVIRNTMTSTRRQPVLDTNGTEKSPVVWWLHM